MKKTVNINLAGIIFHIDEDAFDQLNGYLNRIKKHYKNEDGCEEIASDIEARIAELLQEKGVEIISIDNVEELISILGEPESYEENDEKDNSESYQYKSVKNKKRIYRDGENEIIGGVCSGIAAYFDIDPVFIRLVFIIALFTGPGVLIYLILWAIIPEAKTTAEKLQMKGEEVTAENIKKTIQKEFDHLKTSIEKVDASEQTNKVKRIFQNIISFLANIASYIIRFIAKFFGVILLSLGVFMSFVILTNLIGTGESIININGNQIHPFNLNHYFPLIINDPNLQGISVLGLLLFIGVPVIQLIWLAVRILFSIPKQSITSRSIMAATWIIGIVCLVYVGSQTSSQFQNNSQISEQSYLELTNDTLYLTLNENEFFNTHQESTSYFFDEELNSLLSTSVNLDIKKSLNNDIKLRIEKYASGKSQKQAKINASNIDYDYRVDGNEIVFENYLATAEEQGFRLQSVELTLYIPEGTTVYLAPSLKHFIYDVDNTTNTYDKRMVNHYWQMLNEGLTCKDCY